jgi:hypothetical protein
MTITPVVNPTTAARITPYLSNDMFKFHSMRGVPVNSLVANGSPQDQDAALAAYIEQATGMMDDWLNTSLAATVDVETGPVNVADGYINFQPKLRPVIALLAFSYGPALGRLTAYTSLDGASVQDSTVRVPLGPFGNWMSSAGPLQLGPATAAPDRGWGQWTTCNGFPVTWLTQAEAQGATLLHVADTTGIFAGNTQLTIQAGASRFRFIAGAVSTAGSSGFGTGPGTVVCPALPYAITNSVDYPTYVTALPASVIQAAVLGTRSLIKQTSVGNLVTTNVGGNRSRVLDPLGAGDDLAMMYRLLNSYQVLSA